MVEFDTSPFHVSLSNIFKRNLRLPWLRIHHQNWLYEYNSWFGKFGILCTTDQANVFLFVCLFFFFFNYFSPKVCPPILGYFHYSLYTTLILPYHYPWSKLSGGLLPTTSLEFEFYWAVRFPPISANVNKHWKTGVKGNDVITNAMIAISANKHFASTFSIQMFKFQRRSLNSTELSDFRQ